MAVAYRTRLLAVPLARVIQSPNYRVTHTSVLLCEARDGDATGLAMLWFLSVAQAKVVLEAIRYLAPAGAAAVDAAQASAAMRHEMNFFGYKGVTVIAAAGLELARRDLELRSGAGARPAPRRDRVPAYWSGFFSNATIEDWLAEAATALDQGFRALKVRVGSRALDDDEARVARLRAELGPDTVLMLDANQAWRPDAALAAAERLAPYDFLWLEDPLDHSDYTGLARVVAESAIPIAGGENEYLCEGFEQLLQTPVPYLVADLERLGGLGEWDAVCVLAREHGSVLTPHLYAHVAIHLCAELDQDEVWLEHVDWFEPLGQRLRLVDGQALVPERDGLGFAPDPDAVEHLALDDWEELCRN